MILPERVLGRPGAHWIRSGVAVGADLLAHLLHQILAQRLARLDALLERHVAVDALTLDVVRIADHRGLGHRRMGDQRALHLGRAQAMAADVQHVVDPAGDPVVAVLVAARAVAGEVQALERGEVGLHEAVMVAVDGAHHAGPGIEHHEIALARALEQPALAIHDPRLHAEERRGSPSRA